ncbi:DMT family transporter [Gilvimarinus sp. SDUM040013]|uniref:DMT family transporter n=1 Tax=Gilvimarinus gilvus TaxID=3058038 RepID=A0ABU4S225_9GAMM|nr:DMT family transporter [Gilvimarinus sp. SDUM040013]MDO3385296.1 DMT family transporter [Gilvimarinus sp. SDUM040013]MDX6849279.1 DMT family transporter [Gilvimarinus sp. SDUM040013]
MQTSIAYLFVVLIWSTTPLAIQWSNGSGSFMAAVTMRMSIALLVAMLINVSLGRALFDRPGVWKVYLAASLGIFPGMPLVYWSAQFIPSGAMAIVFAFSPFVTGFFSWWLLGETAFTARRLAALIAAVAGLALVFSGQLSVAPNSWPGVVGMLAACTIFSASSVWLKRLNTPVDAFNQTVGALLFALPGLLLLWALIGGQWHYSIKSFSAIVYLSLGGSLLGFTLFFFVLARMKATAVSLITLIAPVLSLLLGVLVAQEELPASSIVGAGVIIGALIIYLDLWFWRGRSPA